MLRILGTGFAALAGLAFGSFLNVCLSRWPAGESVVAPRSHCRSCGHTLAWWENVPLASWLALRGRCRGCGARIGWRYPLVELAVGTLWAACAWPFTGQLLQPSASAVEVYAGLTAMLGGMILYWLLVALAVLDAEQFWLPDRLTWPGIALGFVYSVLASWLSRQSLPSSSLHATSAHAAVASLVAIAAAGGLILFIRWVYWLIRRHEGIGLGDAKLMALLAAWLGFSGALVAFGLGVFLGALVALGILAFSSARKDAKEWALTKLPLGTFLCVGGIVSGLWGKPIIAAYLRWTGLH